MEEIPLNNSMEWSSSWQAKWFSASKEIYRISWHAKLHYQLHNSLLLVPILGQINQFVHPTIFL